MDVERGSNSSGFPSPQKLMDNAQLTSNLPPAHPHGVRGNAVPLGLLCFGMTTCMLMFVTTGWSPPGFNPAVLAYALFYGGMGQFISGVLEFIKGNTFGGTAFCSYGSFWMGFFVWHYLEASKTVPAVALAALTGDSLWCGLWAILTAAFFVVSLRKNHGEIVVFSTLTLTFILLIGANYSTACKRAAGYVGMFCGGSAIYTGVAMLFRDELGLMLPGVAPVRYI